MEWPQPQKRVTLVAFCKSCLCVVPPHHLGSGLSCDHINQKWGCASGQSSCKKKWQFLFLLLEDPALPCKKSGYSAGETMWKGSVELPHRGEALRRREERKWVPSASAQSRPQPLCQLNADTLWPLTSPYWANKMVIVLNHHVLGGLYLAINTQNTPPPPPQTYLQAWARSLANGAATARAGYCRAAATAQLASASTAKGGSALWITPSPTALNFIVSSPLLLTRAGALESLLTGAPSPFYSFHLPTGIRAIPSRLWSPIKKAKPMCVCAHTGSQLQTVKSCPGTVARKMSCWHLLLESGTDFPIKIITIDDFRFRSTIRTIVWLHCWLNRHLGVSLEHNYLL